ncbi:ABC transporter substrate-binding protein [Rhizobium tubonense]|uniref:Probable sugar-binding periplasmic protein n=1 Tax=Rhizobium tubonense TaxID=484088 RepID=A0A2W4CCB8_9HYPH|nr:ABC transporter substrate-binding protein [Rhizobium tubonense]PZM10902.1 sugar ABC transporter substrate-binding protein [Rhizobium tubonense]
MRNFLMALIGATALITVGVAGAQADGKKAEVLHWWTSGGEAAAVRELANAFNAAGGEWVDTAIAGSGSTARPIGINRIVGGNPPTAMQFNTGTQMNDLAEQGLLRTLDDLAEKQDWKTALTPAFYNAIQYKGHIYGAPINDHGQNWLFYSKAVFQKAGVTDEPKTWDEMFAALDKIKAAGLIPVAVGGQPWQLQLMFNSILLGDGGKELYSKVYKDLDPEAVKSDKFKHVAEVFAKLRKYQDEGSPNRDWNVATGMLVDGKAGIQFMGDWAKGEFIHAGLVADKDFGCVLGPGESNFMMGGDIFVFPVLKDPNAVEAQTLLATVIMSKEGQLAFNSKKGSVPVRLDVDTSKLDACAQKGLNALKDPSRQILAADVLTSQDVLQSLSDLVAQFWTTPTMTADQFADGWVKVVEQAK